MRPGGTYLVDCLICVSVSCEQAFFVLKKQPEIGFAHHYPYDNITADHVERYVNIKPAPGMLMVTCGNDTFLTEMRSLLEGLGYTADMRLEMREDLSTHLRA